MKMRGLSGSVARVANRSQATPAADEHSVFRGNLIKMRKVMQAPLRPQQNDRDDEDSKQADSRLARLIDEASTSGSTPAAVSTAMAFRTCFVRRSTAWPRLTSTDAEDIGIMVKPRLVSAAVESCHRFIIDPHR